MEGFLSTSYHIDGALKHYVGDKNAMLEIEVNIDGLEGELIWGFASIKHCSSYPQEDEVLFNPINIFKIGSCKEKQTKRFSDS